MTAASRPSLHVSGRVTRDGDHALAWVRGRQGCRQWSGDPEATRGEHLLESLADARGGAGMLVLERAGEVRAARASSKTPTSSSCERCARRDHPYRGPAGAHRPSRGLVAARQRRGRRAAALPRHGVESFLITSSLISVTVSRSCGGAARTAESRRSPSPRSSRSRTKPGHPRNAGRECTRRGVAIRVHEFRLGTLAYPFWARPGWRNGRRRRLKPAGSQERGGSNPSSGTPSPPRQSRGSRDQQRRARDGLIETAKGQFTLDCSDA